MKITKKSILTFLAAVGAALVTTLISNIQEQNTIESTVKKVLEEERKQIAEAAKEVNV